jgi:hypothetical protein
MVGKYTVTAIERGAPTWQVWRGANLQVHLRAVEGLGLHRPPLQLELAWNLKQVQLQIDATGETLCGQAAAGLVHEDLPDLYGALPLQAVLPAMRRRWGRIFFAARIPVLRDILARFAARARA